VFGKITDCNNCHTQTSHDQLLPIWSTNNLNQEHLASSGLQAFQTQDIRKLLKHQKNSSISLFSVFFTTLGIHQSRPVSSGQLERRYVPAAHGHAPNSHVSVSRVSPKGWLLAACPASHGKQDALAASFLVGFVAEIITPARSIQGVHRCVHSFHCTACRPLLDLTVPPH